MTDAKKIVIIVSVALLVSAGLFIGGMFTGKHIWCESTDDAQAEVKPLPPTKPPTEWKPAPYVKPGGPAQNPKYCGDRIEMKATVANNVLVVGAEDKCKKNVYTYKIDCPYRYHKYTIQINPMFGFVVMPALNTTRATAGLEGAFIRNWQMFGIGGALFYQQSIDSGFKDAGFKQGGIKAIFQLSFM